MILNNLIPMKQKNFHGKEIYLFLQKSTQHAQST